MGSKMRQKEEEDFKYGKDIPECCKVKKFHEMTFNMMIQLCILRKMSMMTFFILMSL